MNLGFVRSDRSTLGVEWEFGLVDRATAELVPRAGEILDAVRPDDAGEHPKIKRELLTNMLEVITGICRTTTDARADLNATIDEVRRITDPLGIELMCAGTHPFAQPTDQPVSPSVRYEELINRTQWWGRTMLIYGVHMHVGIDDKTKVMPILNALLHYLPHLQSLSASSPFWNGVDTSYASNRAMMFQQLPTAGLPYQFESWQGLESYTSDMLTTGVIDEFTEVRWDIRPAPHLGTIEVRVCDGIPTIDEVIGLSALVQCLVEDFSQRLDRGEELPRMQPWFVAENKWRAARYGMDAILILDAKAREELITDDLARVLERLTPVARTLDCEADLASVWNIAQAGASYQRQREVAKRNNDDLVAVAHALIREMRNGSPLA